MPARVNTKFVIILLALLGVVVLAVIGALIYTGSLFSDPKESVKRGKGLMDAGQIEEAVKYFSKAYHRRRDDLTIIDLYTQALSRMPSKDANSARDYILELRDLLAKAADLQPTASAPLERLMQLYARLGHDLGDNNAWDRVYERASDAIKANPDNLVARKYRGIATLNRMRVLDISTAERALAEEDLKMVLAKTPDDLEAAYHLALWQVRTARFLDRPGGQPERVVELRRQARDASAQWLEGHADDVPRLLARTRILLELQDQDQARQLLERMEQLLLARPEPAAQVVEVQELLVPSDRTPVQREQGLPSTFSGLQRGEALVRAALKLDPENPRLNFTLGEVLARQRNIDPAIEVFTKVRGLKPPASPVDAAVVFQLQEIASFRLGDLLLSRIELEPNAEARNAMTAQVNDLIKQLRDARGEESYFVNMLRGKMAFNNQQWAEAVLRLDRASSQRKENDPEALLLSAKARMQLGETGAAAQRLEQLLQVSPYVFAAHYELALIRLNLNQLDEAWKHIDLVLKANPNDRGGILLRAQLLARDAKPERRAQAIDELKRLEPEKHEELLPALADLYLRVGKAEEARGVVEGIFAKDPKNIRALGTLLRLTPDKDKRLALVAKAREAGAEKPYLDVMEKRIKGEGSLDDLVELLDTVADPVQRALARYQTLLQLDHEKEALAELAKAAQLEPDNAAVIEAQFNDALRQRNLAAAETFATKATRLDIDHAGGLFLQGRLSMVRGDFKRAAAQFQRGVQIRVVYSDGWRMLGDAQRLSNDLVAAADSYRRAVLYRPNNLEALHNLAIVLDARDQFFEALRTLRQAVELYPNNRPLLEEYLAYEERHGEASVVLDLRTQRADHTPRDWNNRRELALLLGRMNRPGEGRKIVEQLIQEEGSTTDNTDAAARLHYYEQDKDEAVRLMTSHMDALGEKATWTDWLKMARFLAWVNEPARAREAYQKAIALEDPISRGASREYADTLFDSRQYDQASSYYQKIWQAKLDAPGAPTVEERNDAKTVGQRYVEALFRSNHVAQAETVLAQVVKSCGEDANGCVLGALVAQAKGDKDQAVRQLDRAVLLAPDRAVVYFQRAEFYASQKGQESLAINDLKKTLELDERSAPARYLLAQLIYYYRLDADQAVAELTTLLKWNPLHVPGRVLLAQIYRWRDQRLPLRTLLEESARLLPNDPTWLLWQGDVLLRDKKVEEAVAKFQDAVKLSRNADTLTDLAVALLTANKPGEALAVFEGAAESEWQSPQAAAVRGRALTALGKIAEGREKFRGALELCTSYPQVLSVVEQMTQAVGEEKAVDLLAGIGGGPKVSAVRVQLALATLENRVGRCDAALQRLSAMELLVEKNSLEQSMREHQVAVALTRTQHYEEARKVYEQMLKDNDRDASALNNLAYLLVEYLNQPKEGLRLALRAKDLAPQSEEVNDTIGWATYKTGAVDEAARLLRQSVGHRRLPSNCYHLASILSKNGGNRQEVLELLGSARTLADETHDVEFLSLADALYKQLTTP